MHHGVRVAHYGGEKDQGLVKSSANGELSCETLITNGGGDEVLPDSTSAVVTLKKKKLTRFDEEVVRLIGQHLESLGLK